MFKNTRKLTFCCNEFKKKFFSRSAFLFTYFDASIHGLKTKVIKDKHTYVASLLQSVKTNY